MKLYIIAIAVIAVLAFLSGSALAAEGPTCTSGQAAARVKATCVRGKATLAARANRRGEGWSIAVKGDACSLLTLNVSRCRFTGFIGDIGCKGVVRVYGASADWRKLRTRLTYFECAR